MFGQIDIYLFDQLLKGRLDGCRNILDVGCGEGRNLIYFFKNGFDVFGIDKSGQATGRTRNLAHELAPHLPADNFQTCEVDKLPYADSRFDAIICNAVLHFARDEEHFNRMLKEIWRVLASGGLLFCRLASSIGIETKVKSLSGRRYLLPDGSQRFLVDEEMLLRLADELSGTLVDPIKTSNVQNMRCMTTWCLRKNN